MTPGVYPLLSAAPAVTALVADRIYGFGDAAQGVTRPYITWFTVAGTPENLLSGAPPLDRFRCQVDCWGDTPASATAVAIAARDALEAAGHIVSINPSDRDPDTNLFRMSFDWEQIVLR